MEKTMLNMRGWGRFRIGSTRLSTVAKFREHVKKFVMMPDATNCMWEFEFRFPPATKSKKSAGRDPSHRRKVRRVKT